MKTFSLALLLVASLAFVLLGCSDNSGLPVTPSEQTIAASSSPASLAKGKPAVCSANGSCNDATFEGAMQNWTFNARRYADGSCDGVVECVVHAEGVKVHGNVLSLRVWNVDGGKAAVIGFAETRNSDYYSEDHPTVDVFVVYDYGEGKKAPPDMYTGYVFWDESMTSSEARRVWDLSPDKVVWEIGNLKWGEDAWDPTMIVLPVRQGNVQVRGEASQ
jgi:hypothetical protein